MRVRPTDTRIERHERSRLARGKANRLSVGPWGLAALAAVLLSAGLTLGVAMILSGCSLSKPTPEKRAFLLRAIREAEAEGKLRARSGVVRVPDVLMASAYEGKELVLRTGESQFVSDFYHEFFTPPGPMLSDELRRWIVAAPLFEGVVDPGSRLRATHTLEGTVTALFGDIREPKQPKAVLGMRFLLLGEESSGVQRLLLEKDYRVERAVGSSRADALVHGWNEALEALFGELESDIAAALAAR